MIFITQGYGVQLYLNLISSHTHTHAKTEALKSQPTKPLIRKPAPTYGISIFQKGLESYPL